MNFIRKFNRQYGTKLNANMMKQGEEETITYIDILCKNILELLFDVEGGKNELNEKEEILKECHGNNILNF